jgi:polysaccharide export outer membrane protein
MKYRVFVLSMFIALTGAGVFAGAQQQAPAQPMAHVEGAAPAGVTLPAGYVIGSQDRLSIIFWRDKDLSVEARVRPDGKISLPLLNDVQAAGLTPEQLRDVLTKAAAKYVQEPNASVIVLEINSRQVFITGNIAKPGSYPLNAEMNVLQLIAQAGGLLEYADAKNILIMRNEGGKPQQFKFNYKDVSRGKHLDKNILLKPGDSIIVP